MADRLDLFSSTPSRDSDLSYAKLQHRIAIRLLELRNALQIATHFASNRDIETRCGTCVEYCTVPQMPGRKGAPINLSRGSIETAPSQMDKQSGKPRLMHDKISGQDDNDKK